MEKDPLYGPKGLLQATFIIAPISLILGGLIVSLRAA